MLLCNRKEVIDGFKIARLDVLAGLLNCLFHGLLNAVHGLCDRTRHFNFFRDFFVEVIDACHIGKKIEREFCIVAKELGHFDGMLRRKTQRARSRSDRQTTVTPVNVVSSMR